MAALRSIAAVLAGLVTAVVVVAAIEAAGHLVYPLPPDLDPSDPEQLRAYVDVLPAGAMAFVLLAWALGSFAGGLVAALIARRRPLLFAGIVGAFILAATIANLVLIPHPAWFAVAAVVAILAATWLAARTAAARQRATATA